ncbi:MAG: hypothetical protein ACT4QA_13425 [Panacagrimonas sp.]
MSERAVLLVGSMPFEDEADCMHRGFEALGPLLFCLPDGEIGEKSPAFPLGIRGSWVNYAMEMLHRDTAHWRALTEPKRGPDGWPLSYQEFQKLEPLLSPEALPEHVRFGYDAFFRQSYPAFKKQRSERGLPQVKFQMGIPTGSALGFMFANPADMLRYRDSFNTVLAREVNAVLRQAGSDVLIQIEVPPELYAAYSAPSMMAELSLHPIYDLLNKIDAGAQIGMHLCLGDFNNVSVVHPDTLNTMVEFSNRLVEGWPKQHSLAYVHYPFAEGQVPPSTDAKYYEPLSGIRLPQGTRFVAGFVHEKRTYEENASILHMIENACGHAVDVACSCGLGRRRPEVAKQLLDYMGRLARI